MAYSFDWSVIADAAPYLFAEGMRFSLTLAGLSAVMGLALGTLLAIARLSPRRLISWPAGIYVNTLRSVPLLLVIFWFYFLMPYLGAWVTGASRPVAVGAFKSAVITFTLFEAAYFCEIMRAGIQSIARGQSAAAQALGLTHWQSLRHIVLPQAVRNMMPALVTRLIILFQDTSLVYVLSLTDFLGAAAKVGQRDGRLVEMYLFVAVVYMVICGTASQIVRLLEQRKTVIR